MNFRFEKCVAGPPPAQMAENVRGSGGALVFQSGLCYDEATVFRFFSTLCEVKPMGKGSFDRDPAMDVIRCAALFCVNGVHFFLNSGFYEETVSGLRMYLMVLMRTGFMVCVPLFIMLSGCLMGHKKPDRNYFGGIRKVLVVYLLASVFCCVFRLFYAPRFLHESVSLAQQFAGLFSFTTAPYGWYIEMYIGLFLLIPYLNLIYRHLDSQRSKQGLLLVLLFLTTAPSITNIFRFTDLKWWLLPSSSDAYQPLLPDWWTGIYPITYYVLGCYLREYPLKLKRSATILLIGIVYFLAGSFNFYRSRGSVFLWGPWQGYGAVFNIVQTVLVFHFFSQLDYSRLGQNAKKFLARLSDLCLGAYLLSWIFDQIFYPMLAAVQPVMNRRLEYFVLIVPAVYLCSLCLSACLNAVYRLLASGFSALTPSGRTGP